MALVIQTVAGVSTYVPYERPPQNVTLWSVIPRGLQTFTWVQTLDAILVTDDALLNLTAILPPNFGYVMSDANLKLSMVAAGSEWSPNAIFNMSNFLRAPADISVLMSSDWVQRMTVSDNTDSSKSLVVDQAWPTFPLISSNSSGISTVLSAFNNAQNARAAGVFFAYLSFWQFDLEQIRKFPINSPFPVHAR